jgi:hypothetical protein
MQGFKKRFGRLVDEAWRTSAPLTAAGLLMLAALAASLVGVAVDPRLITGAPAWLKPAKFGASTAIYLFTLVWVFTYLPDWLKTRRVIGWATAVILVLEVAIIDLQAWRGVTSHFNVGTTLDAALWITMGLAIMTQTLSSVAVAAALWRQRFRDEALGWAFRLGLSITILGASSGGLMAPPTGEQLAEARSTHRMTVSGAHTVGAPDGGPGLPATGWSVEHGDLRVPHFLGLHALQALPLLALALRRGRWSETGRVRLMFVGAGSYLLLFGILLQQALRGQPLVDPDAMTVVAFAAWGVLTALCGWMAAAGHRSIRTPAAC